jgi:hypothetical protein
MPIPRSGTAGLGGVTFTGAACTTAAGFRDSGGELGCTSDFEPAFGGTARAGAGLATVLSLRSN